MTEILDKAGKLIAFIVNGVANFIDFIIELPSFVYNLIEVIPRPLYDILLSFMGLIIFLIALYALGKVVSSVK